MRRLTPMVWGLLALLTAAVAGIVHIGTVLALPWRSPDDAFGRVAALVPPGGRALLLAPDAAGDRLPFRDPAMLTAVCRFDLSAQPFRLATSPFGTGFVTVGFHSRHGITFYGLNVQASDDSSLDLVLDIGAVGRDTGAEGRDTGSPPKPEHAIAVAAPEPEGFVTVSTPLGDGSERADAEQRLGHFDCRAQPGP